MTAVSFPLQLRRVNPTPLETDTVFTTYAAAVAYAASAVSYPGQEVKVVPASTSEPIATYEVQLDKTLLAVGSGGGSVEKTIVSQVDVGDIKAGDVITIGTSNTEFLEKLLAQTALRPGITAFTCAQGFGMKAVGTTISSLNLSATVAKTTNNIKSVTIRRLDTGAVLNQLTNIPSGGVIMATDSGINSGSRTWQVEVEDIQGLVTYAEGSVEFVFPALTGSSTKTSLTQFEMVALDQTLTRKASVTHAHSGSGYIYGLFPVDWGLPVSINDRSGLSCWTIFDHTVVPSLSFGGVSAPYNQFRTLYPNSSSGIEITFNF
jgi:hypothetical protein